MVHLVTAYAGKAHIKSADDGAYNAAFFGSGQYVIESGNDNCFAGSIIDNNTVRILDGEGLMYGRHFRIEPNTYDDMTIETGTTGMNRIDLICMTYEKNPEDETETAYLEVIKGEETTATAVIPAYIDGNILAGAALSQMPLYKVIIKGVVLSGIEPMFEKILNYEKMGEFYYQKHESLAKEYYEKYEQAIEENVGELVEIPSKVTAQVEANTAKLAALANLGKVVYSWTESVYFSYMDNKGTGSFFLGSWFYGEDPNSILEDDADYVLILRTKYDEAGGGKLWMDYSNIDITGHAVIRLFSGEECIGGCDAICNQGYDAGFACDTFIISNPIKKDIFSNKNNLILKCNPHFFESSTGKAIEDNIFYRTDIEISVIKVGYDLSQITGGDEIPDIDYTDLENKPRINGVPLEGDLTSEDLGLSGGSDESGVSSLTDLGVEATAEELNYMTNVTGDVQTQLNNKAEKDHTHEGFVTTETYNTLLGRIKTLEEKVNEMPTITYSDTEPTEVQENTIVMVYETETE